MESTSSQRASETQNGHNSFPPTPTAYSLHFPPPTAQPPIQFPFSDPFHTNRDPFFPGSQRHREGIDGSSRAWSTSQGHSTPNGHHLQRTPPQQQSHPLPPPPPANGLAHMSLPYDPSRRRSLGVSGSPQVPLDPPPPPPPFRHMPPPSPPQPSSGASPLHGSTPRGPPITSPFAGAREPASYSSNRPAGGMSISSILGGNEEKKEHVSPASSTPKSMPPPSPGRVRSVSMREGAARGFRDLSPPRSVLRDPQPPSATLGHDRTVSEPRREGLFASPHFPRDPLNNFRTFQPSLHESRLGLNGHGPPERPSSQPAEQATPRDVEEFVRHERPNEGRMGAYRAFGEPPAPSVQIETIQRHERQPYQNGYGPPSHPTERGLFSSPQHDRERQQPGPMRFQPVAFNSPIRDGQAGLFRPAYPPAAEPLRESIETRPYTEAQRDLPPRSSPPLSDLASFDRSRNGFTDRSMTLEDHQRMEIMQRAQQRKESDGSLHRALLNVSPEINRRGRNSPLPQAVQGAQPRHVGPSGDNASVKMEFGRMFSGLGSGVGTATPTAGYANGTSTPSRMTPIRHIEGGDLVRTAVAEIEEGRRNSKTDTRGAKKNGRRFREDDERTNGRETPDQQRGAKRSKTTHATHHHHHHVHPHHHHHHHQAVEDTIPNPFNTIRFQPNPLSHNSLLANPAHHHHHHHNAHPGHHHHHPARSIPPPRKPTTTVLSRKLLDECAKKPRKHLGSQLYTTELSLPPAAETHLDSKIKFSSKMTPIPVFEGKENCTFTVRVPRWYLAPADGEGQSTRYLEEICKRRQLWGTEVYTDDSDIVAAAVHSGWLKGDFGDWNRDLSLLDSDGENENGDDTSSANHATPLLGLASRPSKPVRVPSGFDAHITVLILPPLEIYASSVQHHLWSREWGRLHDGMSFIVERIEFVDEGFEAVRVERGAKARKERIAVEERRRAEAAKGLVDLFARAGG